MASDWDDLLTETMSVYTETFSQNATGGVGTSGAETAYSAKACYVRRLRGTEALQYDRERGEEVVRVYWTTSDASAVTESMIIEIDSQQYKIVSPIFKYQDDGISYCDAMQTPGESIVA